MLCVLSAILLEKENSSVLAVSFLTNGGASIWLIQSNKEPQAAARISEASRGLGDWQNDAMYYYYDHGPLARVEIGQNNLQGVDYYYNLQGWLKGVNSSVLLDENDPGKDSDPNALNGLFGKDVFGFSLNYFDRDYRAIGD